MATVPQLDHNRTIFTTGLIPSSNLAHAGVSGSVEKLESVLKGTKLEFLAQSHPFTRQLDIVLPRPSSSQLEGPDADQHSNATRLSHLTTRYGRTRIGISDISDPDVDGGFVQAFVSASGFEVKSAIQVLSTTPAQDNQNASTSQTTPIVAGAEDDCWCIDSRGTLTLSVTKATYETLGIVGKKLPFKGHQDRRVIQFPLHNSKGADANRERRKKAFKQWDERRRRLWDVLFCFVDDGEHRALQGLGANGAEIKTVNCQVTSLHDVHIPVVDLKPLSHHVAQDEKDDWYERIANLYEWVGLAGLGAQRLKANDRVDSYVAAYEPPEPSRIGSVDCLRWRGLLGPGFVREVIERTTSLLRNSGIGFASITSSSFTSSPVSYIPVGSFKRKADMSSVKIPSAVGEDAWSLILSDAPDGVRWVMVESVSPVVRR